MLNKKRTCALVFQFLLCLSACMYAETAPAPRKLEECTNRHIRIAKVSGLFAPGKRVHECFQKKNIYNLSWSKDGVLLYYDQQDAFGNYSLYAVAPPLPPRAVLPQAARGKQAFQPVCLPGGDYLFYIGLLPGVHQQSTSTPNLGSNCNLFLLNQKTQKTWPLTRQSSTLQNKTGILSPQISPDGKTVFWVSVNFPRNANTFCGIRQLNLATLVYPEGNKLPVLEDIQTFSPVKHPAPFFDAYPFSPDGTKLLFATQSSESSPWLATDIFSLPLDNASRCTAETAQNLTRSPESWDRYASWSPNGNKIIWSSSKEYTIPYLGAGGAQWEQNMRSELWIMDADGRYPVRLTSFNQPQSPMYAGTSCYVGASAWHPFENKIALLLHKQENNHTISTALLILELQDATPASRKTTR